MRWEDYACASDEPPPKYGYFSLPAGPVIQLHDPIGIRRRFGAERMGLGVRSDGSVGLGLDAPPGVGVPGNQERMNLTVYSNGRAQLRFLNNKTRVKGRFLTDTAGALWFEFLEWSDGEVVDDPRLDEASLQRLLKTSQSP